MVPNKVGALTALRNNVQEGRLFTPLKQGLIWGGTDTNAHHAVTNSARTISRTWPVILVQPTRPRASTAPLAQL